LLAAIINEKGLDKEWVDIALHALEIGMSVEEIIDFFNKYF
jgi:hypothetical protein